MTDPAAEIARWREEFEHRFAGYLQTIPGAPPQLLAAMRYSSLAGGKRIRPLLVYAAGAAVRIRPERLHGLAAALELIHTYSLIHDDLPAMDDDDLRRGQPACHRAFDEATAILAGDALQALAFELLATDPALCRKPRAQSRIVAAVAQACGASGMAGGQVLDLAALNQRIDREQLETMHRLKTGALIRVCVSTPADLAGSPPRLRARLARYGEAIGLAFQIHDDVLDVTASSEQTGKSARSDASRNKPAFPSVLGLGPSREAAATLRTMALAAIGAKSGAFPGQTGSLAWLADYAVNRDS